MKKKKLLSVLVAAALGCSLFAAVPVVSQAATATYTSGDWTYTMDNGCTITKYNGSDKNVVIPSELDGYTIIKIGNDAFCDNKNISSVIIPDSVQVIGDRAFFDCPRLASIDIGNNIRSLGYLCFGNCDSLTSIDLPASMTTLGATADYPFGMGSFSSSSLKTATIASGGEMIPKTLFCYCGALKSVNIPEGITTIGGLSFSDCASLKEIKIPNSVETIKYSAFSGCSSLNEIVLPESIGSVEVAAFNDCSSLKDFYDYNTDTKYDSSIFNDTTFLTMHGFSGSNAEAYAKKNNITFVPLTEKQMYRLYNKHSGEHFYTSDYTEKNNLVSLGWAYEGTAWIAPPSSSVPVYRVYNPNSGEHHYTMNASERDNLVRIGWSDEGIGWYSDDNQGTPLYRLYNPNATGDQEAGGHHYTKDVNEKNSLIAAGWRDEGIGWYGK